MIFAFFFFFFCRSKSQAAKNVSGRYPISHFWDPKEQRLLCCEAKLIHKEEPEISKPESPKNSERDFEDSLEMVRFFFLI